MPSGKVEGSRGHVYRNIADVRSRLFPDQHDRGDMRVKNYEQIGVELARKTLKGLNKQIGGIVEKIE